MLPQEEAPGVPEGGDIIIDEGTLPVTTLKAFPWDKMWRWEAVMLVTLPCVGLGC